MNKEAIIAAAKMMRGTPGEALLVQLLDGPLGHWDTRKTVKANRLGLLKLSKRCLSLTANGREVANLLLAAALIEMPYRLIRRLSS